MTAPIQIADVSVVRAPVAPNRLAVVDIAAASAFVTLAALAWCAVTLAEFGILTRVALILVWLPASGAGLWLVRGWTRAETVTAGGRAAAILLVLVLAGFAAAVRTPAHYVAGGADASVYVAIGQQLAQNGGISYLDPFVGEVPPGAGEHLFRRDREWPFVRNRFPGGLQIDDDSNRIRPNFFHLYPASFAAFELLFGRGAGFYVNIAAALLALAGVAVLGSRLWSPAAGVVASSLLAVQFGEIWFARFPSSDMLSQTFIVWGLCFAVTFVRTANAASGVLMSAAFGLAALNRLDVLVFITPMVAAFVYVLGAERGFTRAWWMTAAVLAAFTCHAIAHALLASTPYVLRLMALALRSQNNGWVVLVTAAAAVVAIFAARVPAYRARAGRWAPLVACVALALVAVVLAAPIDRSTYAYRSDRSLWVILISAPGVALAFAGVAWVLWRDVSLEVALPVTFFLAHGLVHAVLPTREEVIPWILRRVVPVLLPLSCAFIGYFAVALWRQNRLLRPVAAACVLIVGVRGAMEARPIMTTPSAGITRAAVEALAAEVPENAVLLVDGAVASHLGMAVEFIGKRNVITVWRRPPDPTAVVQAVRRLLSRGRPVWVMFSAQNLGRGTITRADLESFHLISRGRVEMRYTDVEPVADRLPQRVLEDHFGLELYSVGSIDTPDEPQQVPLRVDVGSADFPYLLDGFYDAEQMPGASARWTAPVARIALPPLHLNSSAGAMLRMRNAAYRPPGAPPARLRIELDDQIVATFETLRPDFVVYEAPLDERAASRLRKGARILLRSDTFVPAQHGSGDRRTLGVAVDWIAIEKR